MQHALSETAKSPHASAGLFRSQPNATRATTQLSLTLSYEISAPGIWHFELGKLGKEEGITRRPQDARPCFRKRVFSTSLVKTA